MKSSMFKVLKTVHDVLLRHSMSSLHYFLSFRLYSSLKTSFFHINPNSFFPPPFESPSPHCIVDLLPTIIFGLTILSSHLTTHPYHLTWSFLNSFDISRPLLFFYFVPGLLPSGLPAAPLHKSIPITRRMLSDFPSNGYS